MALYKETKLIATHGNPLLPGVQKTEDGYNFTIAVESDKEVSLLLYERGEETVSEEFLMTPDCGVKNIRSIYIKGFDATQYEYNYRIDEEIVTDLYAKGLTGRGKFGNDVDQISRHEVRGCLCERPNVEGPSMQIPYEDMILYKMHVRGFTKHESAQVKSNGTFSGLKEKIPYLKNLGVTSIELMPAYDFDEYQKAKVSSKYDIQSGAKLNYWGYTKGFYFAPKASYCATDEPVKEFANLVNDLHEAGMECLMEFYFSTEVAVGFILEVLRFWRLWYKVDGFHLTGRDVPIEAIVGDPILADAKILYVGFDIGRIYGRKMPSVRVLAEDNMAFQENMRCFLRGDMNQLPGVKWRLRYNSKAYGVINYITSQDGFTLADMVTYEECHNEDNGEYNRDGTNHNSTWNCGVEGPSEMVSIIALRHKQMKNAIWMMMLSQGVPMIYAGDERLNSQAGNNNAYCQDNEISWIDWTDTKEKVEMFEFVKAAITFRKNHRVFHAAHEIQDSDYKSLGIPEISYHGKSAWVVDENTSSQLGVLYCGEYAKNDDGTTDDYFYVAYNMSKKLQGLALPKLPKAMKWEKVVDTSDKKSNGIYESGEALSEDTTNELKVPSKTIIVLRGK